MRLLDLHAARPSASRSVVRLCCSAKSALRSCCDASASADCCSSACVATRCAVAAAVSRASASTSALTIRSTSAATSAATSALCRSSRSPASAASELVASAAASASRACRSSRCSCCERSASVKSCSSEPPCPRLADWFGLEVGEPQPISLDERLAALAPVWKQVARREGLAQDDAATIAQGGFGDFIFHVETDAIFDVTKARAAGFGGMTHRSDDVLIAHLEAMRERKLIP